LPSRSIPYDRASSPYGFDVKSELDSTQGFDDREGNMSEKQPESYEAPSVEEIDTDGKPISAVSGAGISTT
jgi:hypothetical protein